MSARSYKAEALALLLVGVVAQYGWRHAPVEAQADVWNASQALLVLVTLAMLANAYRSRWVLAVAALLGCMQASTAACSLAWLAQPWPVHPGDDQCDAALRFPLSAVGLWLAALLVAGLAQRRRGGGHGPA
jgi:hypothetical protein